MTQDKSACEIKASEYCPDREFKMPSGEILYVVHSKKTGFIDGWSECLKSEPSVLAMIALLKSLRVQAIVNGIEGQQDVTERITSVLEAYEAMVGEG